MLARERVTRRKVRQDIRLQRVYDVAKEHLLTHGWVEFRQVLRDAQVVHDVAGVEDMFPLIRRMLSEETQRELMCGSALCFEEQKNVSRHALDGHGRKLDPRKYLAIGSKARGWIWVGRDVDGDIVEAHIQRFRVQETALREKQVRIRHERVTALAAPHAEHHEDSPF